MKTSFTILILVLGFCMPAIAQQTDGFFYEGIAIDSEGVPVANAMINVQVLASGDQEGTFSFQKTFPRVMTDSQGLYRLYITADHRLTDFQFARLKTSGSIQANISIHDQAETSEVSCRQQGSSTLSQTTPWRHNPATATTTSKR